MFYSRWSAELFFSAYHDLDDSDWPDQFIPRFSPIEGEAGMGVLRIHEVVPSMTGGADVGREVAAYLWSGGVLRRMVLSDMDPDVSVGYGDSQVRGEVAS